MGRFIAIRHSMLPRCLWRLQMLKEKKASLLVFSLGSKEKASLFYAAHFAQRIKSMDASLVMRRGHLKSRQFPLTNNLQIPRPRFKITA